MKETVAAFFSQYKFPLIIGFVGLLCFGYGLLSLISHKNTSDDITFIPGEETQAAVKSSNDPSASSLRSNSGQAGQVLFIDVAGAVIKPGVYQLPEDARLQDALIAAGGMSEDADREMVSKQINLAAKVQDGTKVYVPRLGESITPLRQGFAGQAGITSSQGGGGLVNINSAGQAELEDLPGIGPVTAQKIIDNRPYSSIEELAEKKAVSKSVFEKIKDKVAVY